jgi:DNA invertase Pin-like site-specific DNA recombinase
MKYIAYYRVSTQKQGQSGLGLHAQKSAVQFFVSDEHDCIISEYTDVESGKCNDRPNLLKAIDEAKKNSATLLIAKLDRLSRNAAFIFTLRDSKIDFVCCDMPSANSVTIGIMAVLAQDERERISQRTKAALQEAKKRGKKLGNPQNLNSDAVRKGQAVRKANALNNEHNRRAAALVVSMYDAGSTFSEIARKLNAGSFKTRKGGDFRPIQAQRLYDMAKGAIMAL